MDVSVFDGRLFLLCRMCNEARGTTARILSRLGSVVLNELVLLITVNELPRFFAFTEVKFLPLIFLFPLNMLKALILEKDEFG